MLDGVHESKFSNVVCTASTTVISAAPGVGKRIVVEEWIASAPFAAKASLLSAATSILGPINLPTNGTMVTGDALNLLCSVNEALSVAIDTTGSVMSFIKYQIRG